MPLQQFLHFRRKQNELVFRNLARLTQIGLHACSAQDLLNQLHPWNDDVSLKFDNGLPKFLIFIGIIAALFLLFLHAFSLLWYILLIVVLSLFFLAYLIYEQDDPILEVIKQLEEKMIELKYALNFGQTPCFESKNTSPVSFVAHIKSAFPCFEKGSVSNQISWYASSEWFNKNSEPVPVFIFKYSYVHDIQITDNEGNQIRIKRIEQNLYGIIVFSSTLNGLAISTQSKAIGFPYTVQWESSDISINKQFDIYGIDELQLAKNLNPVLLLRLSEFFNHREGELIFHVAQNMMCFLGNNALFQIESKLTDIQDISSLRGHLRTLRLKHYENLKKDFSKFL